MQLSFICPGRPVENVHIESFDGKLNVECLTIHLILGIQDACEKIEIWRIN